MIFLRIALFIMILAGAGVIAISEMQLKPKLDKLAEDQKKVSEELGKEKQESTKQKDRAGKAEQERDAVKNDLDNSKKAEEEAKKQAKDAADAKLAAEAATNAAKQETVKAEQKAAEYLDLQKLGLNPTLIRQINDELPKKTNELNTLKREQQLINIQLVKTAGELNGLINPKGAVALPAGLVGKVSAVDPKWDFVVLDIGANHGLLRNGELTISREGKLVARVKVGKVETDYAIANVMPGFKKGEIREGDAVLTPSPTILPPQK
ncbi:MAG: hypothetical protein ACKODH_16810 [Limisphaerales bacterium]